MEREFEGRIAVVTGGGSGIGRAVARRLAAGGADVVVANRSESREVGRFVRTDVADEVRARSRRAGCASRPRARLSIDDEENERNIRCVGSAVRDHRGDATHALSVSALTVDLSLDDAIALGPRVVAAARAVSAALGAR